MQCPFPPMEVFGCCVKKNPACRLRLSWQTAYTTAVLPIWFVIASWKSSWRAFFRFASATRMSMTATVCDTNQWCSWPSTPADRTGPGFCHVRFFTYLSAAFQDKQKLQWHGKTKCWVWGVRHTAISTARLLNRTPDSKISLQDYLLRILGYIKQETVRSRLFFSSHLVTFPPHFRPMCHLTYTRHSIFT